MSGVFKINHTIFKLQMVKSNSFKVAGVVTLVLNDCRIPLCSVSQGQVETMNTVKIFITFLRFRILSVDIARPARTLSIKVEINGCIQNISTLLLGTRCFKGYVAVKNYRTRAILINISQRMSANINRISSIDRQVPIDLKIAIGEGHQAAPVGGIDDCVDCVYHQTCSILRCILELSTVLNKDSIPALCICRNRDVLCLDQRV